MVTVTTRNEERLSLAKRADEWRNSITEKTPDKLIKYINSVQQMLTIKLNKIEHEIELKKPNTLTKDELSVENKQNNKSLSSIAELKVATEQSPMINKAENLLAKNRHSILQDN